MDDRLKFRMEVLASLGGNSSEIEELLRYNHNYFDCSRENLSLPLLDEPFIKVWEAYARESEDTGSIDVLAKYLVQMQFPIQQGISQTPEYLAATRRGVLPDPQSDRGGLRLRAAERCRVLIHSTIAGRIPLLIAGDREDFVTFVRALTWRNEPVPVLESMGACMVVHYNNWHRIRLLRNQFDASSLAQDSWPAEFLRIKERKDLFQDCFIILSSGNYSGVMAPEVGLDEPRWLTLSMAIRREHECAHYLTHRLLGSMRTSLLDELIAEYFGMVGAMGTFRADWLLRFFGLESFPEYREGGRLQYYRGDPPLSTGAFLVVQRLIERVGRNLEHFDRFRDADFCRADVQAAVLMAISSLTVEEIASDSGAEMLADGFRQFFGASPSAVTRVSEGGTLNRNRIGP